MTAEKMRELLDEMPSWEADRLAEMMADGKRGWECGAVGDAFVAIRLELERSEESVSGIVSKYEGELDELADKLDGLGGAQDKVERLEGELDDALAAIETLRGLVPAETVARIHADAAKLDEARLMLMWGAA